MNQERVAALAFFLLLGAEAAAEDLSFGGASFSYEVSLSSATIRIDRITNTYPFQTGGMYFELAAIPVDGGSSRVLARGRDLAPLAAGGSYNNLVQGDLPYNDPAPGSYFVELTLLGQCLPPAPVNCVHDRIRRADPVAFPLAPPRPANHSDIWWNPEESGWGLTIADHGTQLFAVWYTYREDGSPTWFVIPGGTFAADRTWFTGDIYETRGSPYGEAHDPGATRTTKVGTASISFETFSAPPGVAQFTYTIGTVTRSVYIQRQTFGNAFPSWGTDFTDIWWNPAESGWGLTLAQHGNQLFGVWFTYDDDGRPLWVVIPGVTFETPGRFTGRLYTARGPFYGFSSFNASAVQITDAGDVTISFDEGVPLSKVHGEPHGQMKTRFRNRVQFRSLQPQGFGEPRQGQNLVFSAPAEIELQKGQAYRHCFCRPDPQNGPCGILETRENPRGGTPPYSFYLASGVGFTPFGISLSNLQGCLTGTPTATGSGQFQVCARDQAGRTACAQRTSYRVSDVAPPPPPPPESGVCSGTGTITVEGRLRDPQQPFCQGALPLRDQAITFTMEMQAWNSTSPQIAQVRIDKGHWICRSDSPTGVSQIFVPTITLSSGMGQGSSQDNAGTFTIDFTLSGRNAEGTISRTFRQSDADWRWDGRFSCSR